MIVTGSKSEEEQDAEDSAEADRWTIDEIPGILDSWKLAWCEARVKPSREELLRTIGDALADSWSDAEEYAEAPDAITDAVLALLPGKTEQEVRADMLDALIDRYLHGSRASHTMPDHVISWIRSQPEYKARYPEGGEQE